jgi:hypothetical protein
VTSNKQIDHFRTRLRVEEERRPDEAHFRSTIFVPELLGGPLKAVEAPTRPSRAFPRSTAEMRTRLGRRWTPRRQGARAEVLGGHAHRHSPRRLRGHRQDGRGVVLHPEQRAVQRPPAGSSPRVCDNTCPGRFGRTSDAIPRVILPGDSACMDQARHGCTRSWSR